MTTALTENTPSSPVPRSKGSAKTGLIIPIVGGLSLALNAWAFGEDTTHKVFVGLYVLAPATVFALLLWWIFFSPACRRTRSVVLLMAGVLVATFFLFIRIDGVDGVMWPILSPRWSKTPEQLAREFREREAAEAPRSPVASDSRSSSTDAKPESENPTDVQPVEITASDWPQFRGPNWDSIVQNTSIRDDWTQNPPKELWRRPCGLGWSSFAVVGDRLFTQEQIEQEESVVCYSTTDGKELWRHNDKARLDTSLGGDGPRATPTVFDSKVYSLGGTGILNCLDAATGKKLWSTDILKDAGINGIGDAAIDWGMSGSPLVDENRVYVNPGISRANPGEKSVAAYDRLTGKLLWASGNTKAGYASPRPADLLWTRQILIFDAAEVAGYEPESGAKLWSFPFSNLQGINVAQPIPLDDRSLFISSGYSAGAARIELNRSGDEWKAEEKWRAKNIFKLKFNDGVLRNGHVYALDEGILACIDAATGERKWRKGRYRYGELLMVAGESDGGDRLVVLTESGEVVLVKVTPEAPEELGQFKAISGTCWNHPVVNRGRVYVRSEQEIACFDIGK